MSDHSARIQSLLEEILDSDVSAEDACREHPELLPEVRVKLAQARELGAHIDAAFPPGDSRRSRRTIRHLASKLPTLVGYVVEEAVGCGGMGVVYRARHVKLNRPVAIKMLLAGGYACPQELARFKREAESIATLCHPNIVQVFDADECEGHPYFVMEFMDGGSLARQLAGHPRTATDASTQVTVLARAVHAAHAAGIIHRDLKPANILLTKDGTLKIADFGLARRVDHADADGPLTVAGARLGTPSYMSPEQAAGAAIEFCPLVDIYALGAILYEMLTGRPPFRGESPADTERQVLTDEPVPPARLNPAVPRDLQTICLKCLQKDPSRRYGSAADLADDLDRFGRGDPILARPVSMAERTVKWCRRRPAATALLATIALILASTVGAGIWRQRIQSERRTERLVRQAEARSEVEAALPLLERLGQSRQWSDAAGVLIAAKARLAEADSPALGSRLALVTEHLEGARELDRIRQSVPEPAEIGYTFLPARDAYARVFTRLGIGNTVPDDTAAARVRESPLRDALLIALDTAAFAEFLSNDDEERWRLLTVARLADPDPWRERFRDAAIWRNLDALQVLAQDARTSQPPPPSHQLVIVSLLLSSLGANDTTIEILRGAQLRDPSDFWVSLELGNALNRAGRRDAALQFFRTAAALKPTHYVAWTTLGSVLIDNGMPDEAVAPLRKAVEIQPGYPTSWQNLIMALADCGRWDEAFAAHRAAVAVNPDAAQLRGTEDWLHLRQARAAAATHEWSKAATLYSQAAAGRYANDGDTLFELAAVQVLAGSAPEHLRVCRTMLDRCERDGLRKFLAARACTLALVPEAELARARRLGTEELDSARSAHWSLTVRGALLCRAGAPRDAAVMFEQSIGAEPDPANAVINWVWLARAHQSLGDQDRVREWLTRATDWLDHSTTMPERIHLHNWLEAQILRREVEAERVR